MAGSHQLSRYIPADVQAAWNTNNSTVVAEAQATLDSIPPLSNVHKVPFESLADSLAAIKIAPRTKVSTRNAGGSLTGVKTSMEISMSSSTMEEMPALQILPLGNIAAVVLQYMDW